MENIFIFVLMAALCLCLTSCECRHVYEDTVIPATCISGGYSAARNRRSARRVLLHVLQKPYDGCDVRCRGKKMLRLRESYLHPEAVAGTDGIRRRHSCRSHDISRIRILVGSGDVYGSRRVRERTMPVYLAS